MPCPQNVQETQNRFEAASGRDRIIWPERTRSRNFSTIKVGSVTTHAKVAKCREGLAKLTPLSVPGQFMWTGIRQLAPKLEKAKPSQHFRTLRCGVADLTIMPSRLSRAVFLSVQVLRRVPHSAEPSREPVPGRGRQGLRRLRPPRQPGMTVRSLSAY